MKAMVKLTGEIVDVYHETQHGQVSRIYKESVFVNGRVWNEDELELMDKATSTSSITDWGALSRQAAISAMQAIIYYGDYYDGEGKYRQVARDAVRFAEALIIELQKQEK